MLLEVESVALVLKGTSQKEKLLFSKLGFQGALSPSVEPSEHAITGVLGLCS